MNKNKVRVGFISTPTHTHFYGLPEHKLVVSLFVENNKNVEPS